MALTRIGLAGLTVMGQNLALNISQKGFPISVYNRTTSKVYETVQRAKIEGKHSFAWLLNSIQKPCDVIMLVKAGSPVDQTIATLQTIATTPLVKTKSSKIALKQTNLPKYHYSFG